MATVVISGLPQGVPPTRLMIVMNAMLKKNGISKNFWITSSSDIPGSDFKEVTFNFPNANEAFIASEVMDNFQFRTKSGTYGLKAYVNTDSFNKPIGPREEQLSVQKAKAKFPVHHEHGHNGPVPQRHESLQGGSSQERYRSRSPHRQSSQLDLELELLRKQRMVIEEERRLLLEKKKLQMVQEYGTSVAEDLGMVDDRKQSQKRRTPPPPDRLRSDHTQGEPSERPRRERPSNPRGPRSLPKFIFPCKHLIKEMRKHINHHAPEKSIRKMLIELVKLKLRTRLAVEMENVKQILSAKQVCDVYRQKYPVETDKQLVQQAAQSIEESHLPKVVQKRKRGRKTKPDPKSNKEENWYIDTEGDGSVAKLKDGANIRGISDSDMTRGMDNLADDEAFDMESGDDYNPDDFEDWNIEGNE